MKQFERVLKGKRDNEISSEYESREKLPKLKIKTPMLVQEARFTLLLYLSVSGLNMRDLQQLH
jgi:hypothetical protein